MKSFFALTLVLVCTIFASLVLCANTPSAAGPAPPGTAQVRQFEAKSSGGQSVRTYIADNGTIMVGVFTGDGKAAAYTAGDVDVKSGASFIATKVGSFGNMTAPDKLTLRISPIDSEQVKLYIAPNPKEPYQRQVAYVPDGAYTLTRAAVDPGSICSTKSGTGACDNVDTDSDWWRCYYCCLVAGCAALASPS